MNPIGPTPLASTHCHWPVMDLSGGVAAAGHTGYEDELRQEEEEEVAAAVEAEAAEDERAPLVGGVVRREPSPAASPPPELLLGSPSSAGGKRGAAPAGGKGGGLSRTAASWVRRTFCMWDLHPDQYVLFKLVADLVLVAVWFPSMLIRTADVYRKTCPPLWTRVLCDEYVSRASRGPLVAFLVSASLVFVVYTLIYRYLHVTLVKRRTQVTIERLYKVYSYFLVFLWLHMYALAAWSIYCYSMHIFHMLPLLGVGVAQDVFIIYRVDTLREHPEADPGVHLGPIRRQAGGAGGVLGDEAGTERELTAPRGMQSGRSGARQCWDSLRSPGGRGDGE